MPQPDSHEELLALLGPSFGDLERRHCAQVQRMNEAYQHAYRYYPAFCVAMWVLLFLCASWLSYMAERPRPPRYGSLNPTMDMATVHSPSTVKNEGTSYEFSYDGVAVACGHRYRSAVENNVRVDAHCLRVGKN